MQYSHEFLFQFVLFISRVYNIVFTYLCLSAYTFGNIQLLFKVCFNILTHVMAAFQYIFISCISVRLLAYSV